MSAIVPNMDVSFHDGSSIVDNPPHITPIDTDSELIAIVLKQFPLVRDSTGINMRLNSRIVDENIGVGVFHGEAFSGIVTTTTFDLYSLRSSTTDADLSVVVELLHIELIKSFLCPLTRLSVDDIRDSMSANRYFYYKRSHTITHNGVTMEASVRVDNLPFLCEMIC